MNSKHSPTKREIGSEYETKAALLLEERGYRILARNVNYPWGEIDLIAVDEQKHELAFVEVRSKAENPMVTPAESVSREKLKRLKLAIQTYLSSPEYEQLDLKLDGMRIDLMAFEGEKSEHWENFC